MPDERNEQSQELDEDVLPEEYPPEQPYGVNERLTAHEEQVGESFEERTWRERPDHLGSDEGRVGTLVAPGGEGSADDVAEEVAEEIAARARHDQLDAGDPGLGGELRDFAAEREEVIPAEEAAMHLTDPPPLDDEDGYVED